MIVEYKEFFQVDQLKVHPKNREHFKDIVDISKDEWEAFKENVKELGVIEPLIVHAKTKEVISGNQRLKACQELGVKTVHCLMVEPESEDMEFATFLSSNVFRRDLDWFDRARKVDDIRKRYPSKRLWHLGPNDNDTSDQEGVLWKQLKIAIKSRHDIRAADIYNLLSEEKQEDIRQWYFEANPKIAELREKIAETERGRIKKDARLVELQDQTAEAEKWKERYQEMITEREASIQKLQKELTEGQMTADEKLAMQEEYKQLQRDIETIKAERDDRETAYERERLRLENEIEKVTTEADTALRDKDDTISDLQKTQKELKAKLKKTRTEYHVEMLENDLVKLIKEAQRLGTGITSFLSTFRKLQGDGAMMTGIEVHIADSKLAQVVTTVERLRQQFDIKILEDAS